MIADGLLRTEGSRFVDGNGVPVRLRGVGLGGWINMENFITGYAANESLMRRTVREVLGRDRYERFFERLLTAFFVRRTRRSSAALGMQLRPDRRRLQALRGRRPAVRVQPEASATWTA